jgi:hypothetical protein
MRRKQKGNVLHGRDDGGRNDGDEKDARHRDAGQHDTLDRALGPHVGPEHEDHDGVHVEPEAVVGVAADRLRGEVRRWGIQVQKYSVSRDIPVRKYSVSRDIPVRKYSTSQDIPVQKYSVSRDIPV